MANKSPAISFSLRLLWYSLILAGLLIIYSSGGDPYANFVYTNF